MRLRDNSLTRDYRYDSLLSRTSKYSSSYSSPSSSDSTSSYTSRYSSRYSSSKPPTTTYGSSYNKTSSYKDYLGGSTKSYSSSTPSDAVVDSAYRRLSRLYGTSSNDNETTCSKRSYDGSSSNDNKNDATDSGYSSRYSSSGTLGRRGSNYRLSGGTSDPVDYFSRYSTLSASGRSSKPNSRASTPDNNRSSVGRDVSYTSKYGRRDSSETAKKYYSSSYSKEKTPETSSSPRGSVHDALYKSTRSRILDDLPQRRSPRKSESESTSYTLPRSKASDYTNNNVNSGTDVSISFTLSKKKPDKINSEDEAENVSINIIGN